MPDGAVRAAHGGGEPGPGRQLARRAEPGDIPNFGEDDQRGERPDARELGEHLDPRVGLRPLVNLPVEPVDRDLQGIDQGQVVLTTSRDAAVRSSARVSRGPSAPAAGRPVMTMVGQDGVDPVARQGPQPDQLNPRAVIAPQCSAPRWIQVQCERRGKMPPFPPDHENTTVRDDTLTWRDSSLRL